MNKITEKIIGIVAVKLVKASMKKVDVTEYAKVAAVSVDKYLDKALGEKPSEKLQLEISTWLDNTVKAFISELKSN